MSELCGEIIAGHRVVRLLGRGGMAEVYEVEHEQLGLRRAMKVFAAEGERAEFLKSRFLAEGRPHGGRAPLKRSLRSCK